MSTEEKSVYFNKKAHDIRRVNLDSSLYYTDLSISFSEKCKCDSLQLESKFKKAFYLYHKGSYDESMTVLETLDSLNKIYKSNYYAYKISSLFGSVHSYTNNLAKALEYSKIALDNSVKLNDSFLIAESYEQLGYLYTFNKLDTVAKKYLNKALDVYNHLRVPEKDKYGLYVTLRETASNYDEFNDITQLCLNSIGPEDASSLAYIYVTGSTFLIERGLDPSRAKIDALKGLKISDSIQYIPLKQIALYNLGVLSSFEGNYTNAISYFIESRKNNNNTLENNMQIWVELSKAYEKLGDFKQSNRYKDSIIFSKDSLYKIRASNEYAEFDVKYKTAEKDKAIAEQLLIITKQNNTRNLYIFSAISLLLVALGIFLWFSNNQKRKKLLIEIELQKEQEINDIRSKFLGNIAHEIRTPLTLITGNLNLALEHFNNTEKAKNNISIALENSKRVTNDANEILELLKFEKNKITLNKTIVLLDETLKRIALSFGSLAQMKEISLVYHSEIPKNYYTSIDLEKNEKIINNLISNAIKYSPSKKEIKVHCELENEILTLQVTDQGEGIHFDETEKIFERFYQSQNAQAVGGVGIGLSLSRELAQIMDGTLTVTSDYGKGSTFVFTLPTPKVTSEVVSKIVTYRKDITPTETPKKAPKSVIKSNILIVEDNPQMASYLQEILSKKHHCTLAFDGEEALQKIEQNTFDLITSDIMMPKMDGFELRKKLNEDAKYRNIPFILISAKSLEEDKIRGFKMGIDDYIIKPFNKNELAARVENLLNNKRAREAWELQNKDLVTDTESSDQKLLKTIEAIVIENLSNEDFKIDSLAAGVNYSQRQLTRILKQYTGMTPVQFILEIRLQKAYQLLQHKTHFTLSEVRYDVGILSSPYFNKKFKERFGIAPSELLS